MVKFGDFLQESRVEKWRFAYVSYDLLKIEMDIIKSYKQMNNENEEPSATYVQALKTMFQKHLDGEIDKVVDFYEETKEAALRDFGLCLGQHHAVMLQLEKEKNEEAQKDLLESQMRKWLTVLETLVALYHFISLNLQGIRKILKKHNKYVDPFHRSRDGKNQHVLQISHPVESTVLHQITFLTSESITRLGSMQEHRELSATSKIVEIALHELESFSENWSFTFMQLDIEPLYSSDCLNKETNDALDNLVSILKHAEECAQKESNLVQVRRWLPATSKCP